MVITPDIQKTQVFKVISLVLSLYFKGVGNTMPRSLELEEGPPVSSASSRGEWPWNLSSLGMENRHTEKAYLGRPEGVELWEVRVALGLRSEKGKKWLWLEQPSEPGTAEVGHGDSIALPKELRVSSRG